MTIGQYIKENQYKIWLILKVMSCDVSFEPVKLTETPKEIDRLMREVPGFKRD